MQKKLFLFLALLCALAQGGFAAGSLFSGGTGTDSDPYILSGYQDWNKLGTLVEGGNDFYGKHFKLKKDYTLSTYAMVGTSDHPFKGNLDGNGYTLTLELGKYLSDGYTADYCAPFRYVGDGATIKNLKVKGTIYTSAKFAAGLVAKASGTVTIQNCLVSATINSKVSGDGSHGGLVGYVESGSVTIEGCRFNGKLLGESTTSCGGFVGWSGSTSLTINDCFFDPEEVTVSSSESSTYSRGSYGSITSYYYESFGTAQGSKQYRIIPDNDITLSNTNPRADGEYSVSKITMYSPGMKVDDNLYALGSESPALKANYDDCKASTGNNKLAAGATSDGYTNYTLTMTSSDVVIYRDDWTGAGTSESPYLINNSDDWDKIVYRVYGGSDYSGKFFKLMADISVGDGKYVGCSGGTKSFKGTFDGDGKTITVSYNNTSTYIGPFCYVDGATIKNLKTAGTITTSAKFAGGIVGEVKGSGVTLTNCVSSVTINSSISGDGSHGGLIGAIDESTNTTITGCVFNGKLLGTTTTDCGGFIGTSATPCTVNITNSFFNPSEVTVGTSGSSTFGRGEARTFTNCYYTQTLGTSQGIQVYSITPRQVTLTFNGSDTEYNASDLTFYDTDKGIEFNDMLYAASENTVSLKSSKRYISANAGTLTYVDGVYNFTLTMPASDVTISKDKDWDGTGTEAEPYLIQTAGDWDDLATNVSEGTSYSGNYFKLTANIEVSTMVGSENSNPFNGIFDGNGNTLRVSYDGGAEMNCAPFRCINGATIKNLIVDGSITSSRAYGAGIAGTVSGGTATITNCKVSATVDCSYSGDSSTSGFVGLVKSGATLNISGCAFTGNLTGANASYCAGFAAYKVGSISITDCVFAPANVTVSATNSVTFIRGGSITNCFYTQTLGEVQGKAQHAITGSTESGKEVTVTDIALSGTATEYNVSGITAYANGGLSYGGTLYYGDGDKVDFNANTEFVKANYGEIINNSELGTTSDWYSFTITMADANATISKEPVYLYTDKDNSSTITKYKDQTTNVKLKGRTFKHDGSWQTLCLPFNVASFEGTPLEGATIMKPKHFNSNKANRELEVTTEEVTSITAHLPYFVKWTTTSDDVADPVFSSVKITESNPWAVCWVGEEDIDLDPTPLEKLSEYEPQNSDNFTMVGLYHSKGITKNHPSISGGRYYYITGNGIPFSNFDGIYTVPAMDMYIYAKNIDKISFTGISEDKVDVTLYKDDSGQTEGSKNANIIANNAGKLVEVSIKKDADNDYILKRTRNSVQTICLPFDLDYFDDSDLNGFTVLSPTYGEAGSDGKFVIYCDEVTSIKAHKPYIIKWAKASESDITNPTFADKKNTDANGLRIKNGSPEAVTLGNADVTLCGVYTPKTIASDDTYYYVDGSSSPAKVVTNQAGTVYAMEVYIQNLKSYTDIKIMGQQTAVTELWDGKGTESNKYKIQSVADLHALATAVNNGEDFSGYYFQQTDNLDYSGSGFNHVAIGTSANPFNGIYNGNGHSISNVSIDKSDTDYQGIFGYIGAKGGVSDLALVSSTISGKDYVGGIVGYYVGTDADGGVIRQCHVADDVTITATGSNVGGIAGYSNGSIEGCTSYTKGIVGVIGNSGSTYGEVTDCLDLENTKIVNTNSSHAVESKQAYTVESGTSGLTLDYGTADTQYGNFASSICAYSGTNNAGYFNDGLLYNEKFYTSASNVVFKPSATPITSDKGKLTDNTSEYTGTYKLQHNKNNVIVTLSSITLADASDNSSTLSNYNGSTLNVTISGRTLYKDGSWNTICLPFDMTDEQITEQLNPTSLMELDVDGKWSYSEDAWTTSADGTYQTGFNSATGTLSLFFKNATSIEAGKPYLIKWTKENDYEEDHSKYDISNPEFTGVTINSTASTSVKASNTGYQDVEFIGSYKPVTLIDGDKSKLYLGADNMLYYPSGSNVTINAFRAYFYISYLQSGGGEIKAFVLNFGEGIETGIEAVESGMLNVDSSRDAWYDMSGRKLSSRPTQRGIYINNGKKIAIK